MRTSNLANQALRHSEVGHVWEEQLTNSTGTLEIPRYATFRVRASAGTTVTIDGVLAMTMMANEIVLFNAGYGDPTNPGGPTVTVVIAGANAYVQVARDFDRKQ